VKTEKFLDDKKVTRGEAEAKCKTHSESFRLAMETLQKTPAVTMVSAFGIDPSFYIPPTQKLFNAMASALAHPHKTEIPISECFFLNFFFRNCISGSDYSWFVFKGRQSPRQLLLKTLWTKNGQSTAKLTYSPWTWISACY